MMPRAHVHAEADRLPTPPPRPAAQPPWIRDLVRESRDAKNRVAEHQAWRLMREGTITWSQHRNLMVGFWPLIEKFPQFLALNLLKATYGREPGINAARSWLASNLRVEERHAEWFLDWAEALGVSRDEMLDGWRPVEMTVITDWCWRVCERGELAEAMAATNYAIEGVTGEWVAGVAASERYARRIPDRERIPAMRWLQAHADYDAAHPLEALRIIGQLVGDDPPREQARAIGQAVMKSYELYVLALDVALQRAGTP